ncbi:MAG: cobalt-precorrin-5B (C(1))-methyltransferase CbiD [Elainellaceae cyanobacterium]
MIQSPGSGYTLPVFACGAAVAALKSLQQSSPGAIASASAGPGPVAPAPIDSVPIDLINPAQTVDIAIEQVARLDSTSALAITRSQPGDNLDLTRDTPIWARVRWADPDQTEPIAILGGEGLGQQADGAPAIYSYARRLLNANLKTQLQPDQRIEVILVLPEGRRLAERTSNSAFGVVDGLSLLGTSGIAQPLSAPQQLDRYRQALQQSPHRDCVVLCIGENGLDLARRLGISTERSLKTANWIGPMLVEAAVQGIESILLLGYHGKLLKLAGGIFHTHHHLADGRQEILAAYSAAVGLPMPGVQAVLASATAEAALSYLRGLERRETDCGQTWADVVYRRIAERVEQRSCDYIYQLGQRRVPVGCLLFDRQRHIVVTGEIAAALLPQVC